MPEDSSVEPDEVGEEEGRRYRLARFNHPPPLGESAR